MKRNTAFALAFVFINVLTVAILIISNLYSLTYTAIPVSAQHLWYATDLSTYLFWTHAINTGIGLLIMLVCNAYLIINFRSLKKEE